MKRLIVLFIAISTIPVLAQSKKELLAEVEQLKQDNKKLAAEIDQLKNPPPPTLETEHQKASYALGVLMASNLKNQGSDSLDANILSEAIQNVLNGESQLMEEQDAMMIVQPYMANAMERKSNSMKAEGLAYLETNKSKDGVVVTESGLQYRVLSSGEGKTPTVDNSVTVHYTGKLVDGTVFDSSVERGQPATFGVGQVIDGWTEALLLMKEGDKFELVIPSELAYGERGAGGRIPPHAVLIFEVELIKIN